MSRSPHAKPYARAFDPDAGQPPAYGTGGPVPSFFLCTPKELSLTA